MPLSAELAGTNPFTLFVEPQGALWIGTDKGASRYENGVTRRFTKADGLAEERVNVFFRDHDENLWLGTGAGLVRYRQVSILSKLEVGDRTAAVTVALQRGIIHL